MNVQTLMVFHDLDTPDSQLLPALRQAGNFDPQHSAHLEVLILAHSPTPPMAAGFGGGGIEIWGQEYSELDAALKQKKDETIQWIEGAMETGAASFSVDVMIDLPGSISESVGRRMRYADMSLVPGKFDPDNDLWRSAFTGAITNTGRPAMVLNEGELKTETCKQVLIAWDASPAASIAVHHAIPLMKSADDVQIAMVDPIVQTQEFGDEPGAGLAAYLARHDIKATVCPIAGGGNPVSDVLLRQALDVNADLMVMGAYSHWRLQDWLFGSTTGQILERAACPLLLAR